MRLNLKIVKNKKRFGRLTEAALFDSSGNLLSIGDSPEIRGLEEIFIPAAGFVQTDHGGYYIDGDHLVTRWGYFVRAAPASAPNAVPVVIGHFVDAFKPVADAYDLYFCRIQEGPGGVWKLSEVYVENGTMNVAPLDDVASAANMAFYLYSMRLPLVDPNAARKFVNAL